MAIMAKKVCRTCRRLGMKLYLKGGKCYSEKCPFEKRPFPPGQHGRAKRFVRFSDYGIRLAEKQKLKHHYFMKEEQFRKFFNMALKWKGNTGAKFLELLERRLDNVVMRIGFSSSLRQARQLVSHGHVKVNGQKVDIPSYIVDVGDIIQVDEKFAEDRSSAKAPGWIELVDKNKAKIVRLPERKDFDLRINENLIVEFYSR